jgi:hypothetical protein
LPPSQNSTQEEYTADRLSRLEYQFTSSEVSPSARQIVSAVRHIAAAPSAAFCGSANSEAARRTASRSAAISRRSLIAFAIRSR